MKYFFNWFLSKAGLGWANINLELIQDMTLIRKASSNLASKTYELN